MAVLATWGGDKPWSVHVIGRPKILGGDGRRWVCECPKGNPKVKGYPCRHITDLWTRAEEGLLSNSFNYTPFGNDMANRCRCRGRRGEPMVLVPMPPKERPAATEGPSRNKPCPCGSLRPDGNAYWFKHCHALPPERRPPEARPWTPEGAEPERNEEEQRQLDREVGRGRRRVERAERAEERKTEIDRILDRVHAWDEARRQRRKAAEKARATAPKVTAKKVTAKKVTAKKVTAKKATAKKVTAKKAKK